LGNDYAASDGAIGANGSGFFSVLDLQFLCVRGRGLQADAQTAYRGDSAGKF